jgi:DNA-binding response OmpR family regulator
LHQAAVLRRLARPLLIHDPGEDPAVAEPCKILIADRNRHVREFLRRELGAEGYQVEVTGDGREVLNLLGSGAPPHLLILDLEIPHLDEMEILARLKDRRPPLPVVIHTFLPESATRRLVPLAAAFLEKQGDTDHLKAVVAEVLDRHYPRHFFRVKPRV